MVWGASRRGRSIPSGALRMRLFAELTRVCVRKEAGHEVRGESPPSSLRGQTLEGHKAKRGSVCERG
jgi:hypothetical protein